MSDVTAIWTTKNGCSCRNCRTTHHEYHAAVAVADGEQQVIIDEATYDALAERATSDDYREGSYIGFARPVEWGDVFAEDRVP